MTPEEKKAQKAKYTRTYYLKYREKILIKQRLRPSSYMKEYYEKNKEIIAEKQKIYAEKNKEAIKVHKKAYCKIYNRKNRVELNEKTRKWRKDNPDKAKGTDYKFLYGITINDYKEMFEKQKGCCAMCNKHQSVLKRKLNVDHCHATGKVRGLLCRNCNVSLGLIGDNINILYAAIKHLS